MTLETTQNTMNFARERLEQAVAKGVRNAGPVIQHILSSQTIDSIVPVHSADYRYSDGLQMNVGDRSWSMHKNAQAQMLERLGGSKLSGYAHELIEGKADWQRELLLTNLRELARHSNAKWLVRSVDVNGTQQARAVLSDKFRRLDNRPLLDSFIGAATAIGAVPYDGVASDLSASVRAIIPRIYEPVPGEALVFGLSWTNSDFGARQYAIAAFVLRLVCLNGMVGASQLKQVHLGGRLSEDLQLSQKTYDLDTRTMVSATNDVVRGALNPKSIDLQLDMIRRAASTETDLKSQWAAIGKALSKKETETVRQAFDGPDVINLPAGNTAWRLSNALSWVANTDKLNPERKIELQSLAGSVVN
jgi:hypothetical protein